VGEGILSHHGMVSKTNSALGGWLFLFILLRCLSCSGLFCFRLVMIMMMMMYDV
jgi:hypothetical protein